MDGLTAFCGGHHGGETCRVHVAERRRAPHRRHVGDALSGHLRALRRVHASLRGPPLRTSVGRHTGPKPLAVSAHPALRIGIIGAGPST